MASPDPQIAALQQSLEQARLRRAEDLTPAEKFRLGLDLYDQGIRWVRLAIAAANPGYSAAEVDAEIDRRKKIARAIDERGIYEPYPAEADNGED